VISCFGASSSIIVKPNNVYLAKALFKCAVEGDTDHVRSLLRVVHPNDCICPILGGVLARFIEISPARKTIPVIFQLLVDAGADLNARNMTGGTVLHALAGTKLPNSMVFPCIYAVIERGIDITLAERFGEIEKTALQRAYYFKRLAEEQRQRELIHRYGLRIAFMHHCNSDKDLTKTVADFYSCSREKVNEAFDKIVFWRSRDSTKYEQIYQYLQES
jgi:hypothetical protein